MSHITTVSHGNFSSVPRRSYLSTEAFNTVIFSYSTSLVNSVYVGTLSVLSTATAGNCPAGRILHETGKKLFPGANNGVTDYMVSVYDPISMLTGFINPNQPFFSIMNTDRANFLLDGPNGTGSGLSASARANALYTRGDVLAGGRLDISGNAIIYGTLDLTGDAVFGGDLDVAGDALIRGNLANIRSVSNITDSGSMAVTAAEVAAGIVTATITVPRNIQLPTAASIITLIGSVVGTTIEFTYINLGAQIATFTVNTGTTIVGAAAVAASISTRFLVRVTSGTTVVVYRS